MKLELQMSAWLEAWRAWMVIRDTGRNSKWLKPIVLVLGSDFHGGIARFLKLEDTLLNRRE